MATAKFLSDEEMAALEASGQVQTESTEAPEKAEISAPESYATGASVSGSFGLTRPVLTAAGMATGLPAKESWSKAGEFISEAKKQNPKSYGGGVITGIAAPAGPVNVLMKGGMKAAKPIKGLLGALPMLVRGTVASGVQAGGQAVAEDRINQAADDMLMAMGMNVGAAGAGEVVKGGARLAKEGGKRLISSLQNISREAVDTYMANKPAVLSAIKTRLQNYVPGLADDLTLRMREVEEGLEKSLQEAAATVKGSVDMTPVLKAMESEYNAVARLKLTPSARTAASQMFQSIDELTKSIDRGDQFAAKDLLTLKRQFQAAAEAVYEGGGQELQQAFASVAQKTADYAKKVIPGAKELLEKEQLAIRARNGLGLTTKVDPARLKNVLATASNPDKIQKGVGQAIDEFDRIYGTGLKQAGDVFRSAAQLSKEDILAGWGTGRALLGGVTGGAIAGPVGGFLGLLAQSPGLAKAQITGLKGLTGAMESVGRKAPILTRAVEAARK